MQNSTEERTREMRIRDDDLKADLKVGKIDEERALKGLKGVMRQLELFKSMLLVFATEIEVFFLVYAKNGIRMHIFACFLYWQGPSQKVLAKFRNFVCRNPRIGAWKKGVFTQAVQNLL